MSFFEVNFTLYGIFSIGVVAGTIGDWISGRNLWKDVTDLPGLGFVLSAVPHVKDALVLPLVWFAVAAVVYGLELSGREVVAGTRLEPLHERLAGRPRRLGELVSRNLREKYVPLLHAARLVFRAGGPVVALFCLCYVAIGIGLDLAQRGVAALIGPVHTVQFWNVALVPMEFAHGLLYEVLRLALLVAMFDLAVSARDPAVSARTPAPAPRSAE